MSISNESDDVLLLTSILLRMFPKPVVDSILSSYIFAKRGTPIGVPDEPPTTFDPADKGGLSAALSLDRENRRLRLDFGKSVIFLSMTSNQARAYASALNGGANALDGLPPVTTN